ncbi:DUF5362 family protein [uncultured Draconibacterium sp.]|uniref:DUF5362 family protein n=1 Tax=uncultured Draconibacterium sp. TaxID=1573823 RepID=UPI003217F623
MNTTNETPGQEMPEQHAKLEITNELGQILQSAGKWGKFLAILGFVFMGMMVFGGFVMSIVFLVIPGDLAGEMPFPPFLFGLIYLIIGAIYFLPILYLYRFSSNINKAVHSKNQDQLNIAFTNLKAHYRFIGIFTIVMFALYILAFIIMMFVGIFAGFADGVPGLSA